MSVELQFFFKRLTNMLSVEPWAGNSTKEELTSIGVRSSIGHTQNTWSGVLKFEVFILELITVDTLSSSTVAIEKRNILLRIDIN